MTVDEWNKRHAPGVLVDYREDDGSLTRTRTRSIAWEVGYGEPVVQIKDRTGCSLLSRVTAVDAPTMPDPTTKDLLDCVSELLDQADANVDPKDGGGYTATVESYELEQLREAYRAARNAWRERRAEG